MTRVMAALVLVVLIGGGSDILACGDKFLMAARGTRFERPRLARAPARILLYASPNSRFASMLARLSVEDGLRKVGDSPATVSDPGGFERALHGARWDLVIVDLADRRAIGLANHDVGAPAFVAVAIDSVAERPNPGRLAGLVKSPRKFSTLLGVVDDVLVERAARARAAARKAS